MTFDNFTLSIIIPNFNYAQFVGVAIQSALDLDWPRKEIIVVDDGSTDNSRDVIDRFVASGVRAIYPGKVGQTGAFSVGYAESRGEVVYVLDSDDIVHPQMMRQLALHWRPGVSKFQFPMAFIDSAGQPSGGVIPKFRGQPTPEQIRLWYGRTGLYPTPPGSGNVYMRSFLEHIMPLEPGVDRATDSYMIYTAPFFGDVITVEKALASYRIHSSNQGSMAVLKPERFATDLARYTKCLAYSGRVAQTAGATWFQGIPAIDLKILALRSSSYALDRKNHPIANDGRWKILKDLVRSVFRNQGYSMKAHSALALFLLAINILPQGVARAVITYRYVRDSRPKWLQKLVTGM